MTGEPQDRQDLFGVDQKERESATPRRGFEFLASPITLAVLAGFIGVITNIITNHYTTIETIRVEQVKAERALESDLIKKFVENPDVKKVRFNLKFLVDVGLVPEHADKISTYLKESSDESLPSLGYSVNNCLGAPDGTLCGPILPGGKRNYCAEGYCVSR